MNENERGIRLFLTKRREVDRRVSVGALWTLSAVAALVTAAVGIVLFAPGVDNLCGVLTRVAMRSVQQHREDGIPIRNIVAQRYENPRWHAYHTEYLAETYVRCDAQRREGGSVSMVWVVIANLGVEKGRPRLHLTTTAHNVDASKIAPSLVRPGQTLYRSPDIANW